MKNNSLNATLTYDIAMIVLVLLLVLLIPPVYDLLKSRIKILRIFNGEFV